MILKQQLVLIMSILSYNVYAAVVHNSSVPVISTKLNSPQKLASNSQQLDKLSNLSAVDIDSNDLNQLNRKLQLEKVETEIKKLKNNTVRTNNNSEFTNENAQTTVTGVAINQEGNKIAWLQFADGGSLTVNIGSKVGKYTVVDISMNGVMLRADSGKKRHRSFFLRRVYTNRRSNTNSANNLFFTPSPVLTEANAKSDTVPPIVSLR